MLISKYYPSKALIWDIRWSKQIIHDINIPQIIHFIFGFPLVNHPAIEVPPWLWKPRLVKILSNPCIRLLDGSPIHPSSHHSVVSYVRNAQTNHLIAALGTESTARLTWSFTTFPRGVVTWEVWMPGFYYQRNPTNGLAWDAHPIIKMAGNVRGSLYSNLHEIRRFHHEQRGLLMSLRKKCKPCHRVSIVVKCRGSLAQNPFDSCRFTSFMSRQSSK